MVACRVSRRWFSPHRWGLTEKAVVRLADDLQRFFDRFRDGFRTQTRDSSAQASAYLRGLLTMEEKRTFAKLARKVNGLEDDGQALQHFMSNSPWSARAVLDQVQREIAGTAALRDGGVLILDESAEEKAGPQSAGARRQHNGRLGKVEMSQVGVFLAWAKGDVWTWVDGELFLPEAWFGPGMATERESVGIPLDRRFQTKIELGWAMVQRAQANGLPFEALVCDETYGRSGGLRRHLDRAGVVYMADVPEDTGVYLTRPEFEVPRPGPTGRPPTQPRVLNGVEALEARQVAQRPDTVFHRYRVRPTERGELRERFAVRRVWTIRDGERAEEWLVIREESPGRFTYALSNAPPDTSPERLAWLKCARYFVERANQDAKSEMGWDELQARKYRAWEHHLAMTILATWFVAETKLKWSQRYPRDPSLAREMKLKVLPSLSVANVRAMLKAAMPLERLSPKESLRLVVQHLVNRSRSTRSRLKGRRRNHGR